MSLLIGVNSARKKGGQVVLVVIPPSNGHGMLLKTEINFFDLITKIYQQTELTNLTNLLP